MDIIRRLRTCIHNIWNWGRQGSVAKRVTNDQHPQVIDSQFTSKEELYLEERDAAEDQDPTGSQISNSKNLEILMIKKSFEDETSEMGSIFLEEDEDLYFENWKHFFSLKFWKKATISESTSTEIMKESRKNYLTSVELLVEKCPETQVTTRFEDKPLSPIQSYMKSWKMKKVNKRNRVSPMEVLDGSGKKEKEETRVKALMRLIKENEKETDQVKATAVELEIKIAELEKTLQKEKCPVEIHHLNKLHKINKKTVEELKLSLLALEKMRLALKLRIEFMEEFPCHQWEENAVLPNENENNGLFPTGGPLLKNSGERKDALGNTKTQSKENGVLNQEDTEKAIKAAASQSRGPKTPNWVIELFGRHCLICY